ncbi:MAG TPA: hypothetical protein VHE35_09545 [Kofleriaceae bacterium]|nr:hypothetical protein [Kofleriaceae bacterium]
MFVRRNPAAASSRARRVWPWCALAALSLSLALAACNGDQRCSSTAECDTGQVCSNEKNPLGDGVCIEKCTPHPNAPACPIDAGPIDASPIDASPIDASPTVDAEVDAAPAAHGATP